MAARQAAPNPPTAQARKLGLVAGMRVFIDGAPPGWSLDDPPAVDHVAAGEPADLIVLFLRAAEGIESRLAAAGALVRPAGTVWAAWPRKAAGHVSDLGDVVIREAALALGLVDTKVAAIDVDWSGLKLVWRRSER